MSKKQTFFLGLLGESKSGKDWFKKQFLNNLPNDYSCREFRCADVLKLKVEEEYPTLFSREDWETLGDSYREGYIELPNNERLYGRNSLTRRMLLQLYGDKLLEESPTYVLDYIKSEMGKLNLEGVNLVTVPDLRKPIECEAFKSGDFKSCIVKVKRALKYRYPELYNKFRYRTSEFATFEEYLKVEEPKIYNKLNHITETSIEEVPSKLINFTLNNNPGIKLQREVNSLVMKLSSCI